VCGDPGTIHPTLTAVRRDQVTQWLGVGLVAVTIGLIVKLLGAPPGSGIIVASAVVVVWWLAIREGAREAHQAAVLRGWAADRRRTFVAAPERPCQAGFLSDEHVEFRNAIIGDGTYLGAFVCSTGSGEASVGHEYTIAVTAASLHGVDPFTLCERAPGPAGRPFDPVTAAAAGYRTQPLDDPWLRDRFQVLAAPDHDVEAMSRLFSPQLQATLAALDGNSFLHRIEFTGTELLVASQRHLRADTADELDAESRAVLAVFVGDALRWPPAGS
jgi:hypothetical protein